MPKKPAEKCFKKIEDLVKGQQIPKPNKIAEKFKFNMRDRKEGESLSEHLAELELCRLTEHCHCFLSTYLSFKFIYGS